MPLKICFLGSGCSSFDYKFHSFLRPVYTYDFSANFVVPCNATCRTQVTSSNRVCKLVAISVRFLATMSQCSKPDATWQRFSGNHSKSQQILHPNRIAVSLHLQQTFHWSGSVRVQTHHFCKLAFKVKQCSAILNNPRYY